MTEYNDYPITVIAESMQKQIARGATTYQKWTCAGCGERVTANDPDVVYRTARHEDCGVITDIEKQGCNFMFILRAGRV